LGGKYLPKKKETTKCPKCGGENEPDAKFCQKCGYSFEGVKVKVVTPITGPGVPTAPGVPTRGVPPIGSCFYHKNIPAAYICSICGRSICRDCAKSIGAMIVCPECYARRVPPGTVFPPTAETVVPPKPLITPFVLSMLSGVIISLNAILLPTLGPYWFLLLIWPELLKYLSVLIVIGLVTGVTVILGSLLIYRQDNKLAGSIMVIIGSIASLLVGGGFYIGIILGIFGGILALR